MGKVNPERLIKYMEGPRHWRLQEPRYRLIGTICPEGHKIFPPREICPHCTEEAKMLYQYAEVFAKLVGIRVSSKADEKIGS